MSNILGNTLKAKKKVKNKNGSEYKRTRNIDHLIVDRDSAESMLNSQKLTDTLTSAN